MKRAQHRITQYSGIRMDRVLDFCYFVATVLIVTYVSDDPNSLPYLGLGIICFSILVSFKARRSRNLLFLSMIILFINLSFGFVDLIGKGLSVADWQMSLRLTAYNVHTGKSILLFMSIINMFIIHPGPKIAQVSIERKRNVIISSVGLLFLFIILFLGYGESVRKSAGYASNRNPFYEYSIVIYLVVWFFSKNLKLNVILLRIHSILYVVQSLFYGDRSAAFLMVILVALLEIRRISIRKLSIFSIIAVLLSNFIAINRNYGHLETPEKLKQMLERGLYSDTVSYAYYSSITITALHDYSDDGQNEALFIEFLKSVFRGTTNAAVPSLTVYIRENFGDLFNRGGGIYSSHFFAYFGYAGVVVSAIILGLILRSVYYRSSPVAQLYQVLIVTFSIRWYLYNPIALYRSVLFIFSLLLFLSLKAHEILSQVGL